MTRILLKFMLFFLLFGRASSKKVKFDDYVFQTKIVNDAIVNFLE